MKIAVQTGKKKKQKHSHYRCLRASTGIYLQVLVLVPGSVSSSASSSVLVSAPAGPVEEDEGRPVCASRCCCVCFQLHWQLLR